jgi:hypothetical protein
MDQDLVRLRLMRKILYIFFCFSIAANASGFKKYAGEFLSLGAGGRATGMGNAYVAVANDVTAGYWNPAGLVDAQKLEVLFMHTKQFISSVQHNFLAASWKMDEQTVFAASFLYLTVNGIQDTRDAYNFTEGKLDYSKIKSFNTGDYVFYLSYAKYYTENLSYGLNVKIMRRDYEVESAVGVGFDLGLKYRITDKFIAGIMLRDITTSMMTWSTGEKEFITPSIHTGLSYLFRINSFDLGIQPAVDFNILFENRDYAAQLNLGPVSVDTFAGLEMDYKNTLAVRIGVDDLSRFNTGIGIQIPKISFDYSFTSYQSELNDIHRISFHLKFDRTAF